MSPTIYWDWALYFYVGTVILQMSPRYFWRCTPRKFNALCRVHARLNSTGDDEKITTSYRRGQAIPKQPETYIDKIM
jgi:hypothetical protein